MLVNYETLFKTTNTDLNQLFFKTILVEVLVASLLLN